MELAEEKIKQVLNFASSDERVRAVLLNGSRANPDLKADRYQDYDIVYIVTDLKSFTSDHSWAGIFGNRIIWQLPDEMVIGQPDPHTFGYLMLFEDGTRIDLTLYPVVGNIKKNYWPDSLTVCLMDKDRQFEDLPLSSNKDYLIKPPIEKEFTDTCNEFWWVTTYVAKGLLRKEITYAKEMHEGVVRPMFMQIVKWYIGVNMNFSVEFGKSGRFMKQYLPNEQYELILATYSNHEIESNWKSLFIMAELFAKFARTVADDLKFRYNIEEEKNVIAYLKKCRAYQNELHL